MTVEYMTVDGLYCQQWKKYCYMITKIRRIPGDMKISNDIRRLVKSETSACVSLHTQHVTASAAIGSQRNRNWDCMRAVRLCMSACVAEADRKLREGNCTRLKSTTPPTLCKSWSSSSLFIITIMCRYNMFKLNTRLPAEPHSLIETGGPQLLNILKIHIVQKR